jgi:EmrB/QacA subfamily drug resistance transporter
VARQTRLPYKAIVAIAFVLGLFMDILDTTIVNVALPDLAREFSASTNTIEWVVTGYLLSLALWIPASGWLGDRFGTKKVFVFALVMFTLASALCGAAWNIESLVAFRVLQGVGGGMLTPVGTAMLYRAYPPEERPRASSILSMVTVLAPAIGPVFGGFLVEKASWRWIFYVNLPIGVAGVVFSVLFLREHKEPTALGFDVAGFLLAGASLASLLFGLAEGPSRGWGSGIVVGSLIAGAVLTVALVVVELRVPHPMLDLRLLADRSFRTPNVVSFAAYGSLMGVLFLLPQFLQGPRGLSPLQSGLTTFPQAFGVLVMARLVGGKLYPVIGPRRLAMFGAAVITVVSALFLLVDLDTSQWWIRLIMFTRGLGLGFIFIPLQAAAFARVPLPKTGRASALFQVQRQAGAAVGVAMIATVLVERLTAYGAIGSRHEVTSPEGWLRAFHQSIAFAVLLGVVAVASAWFIKDADAAPTMKRREAAPAAR